MSLPDLPLEVSQVQDMAGFVAFLESMARDFAEDQAESVGEWEAGNKHYEGRWTHMYVGDFLETWAAWLRDACMGEGAPIRGAVEPLTWQSLAFQIHVGRAYE